MQRLLFLILGIVAWCASSVATANDFTFAFTGTVSQISGINEAGIQVGDEITGTYTFIDTGDDCSISPAELCITNAVTMLDANVAGLQLNFLPGEIVNQIYLIDIASGSSVDLYVVNAPATMAAITNTCTNPYATVFGLKMISSSDDFIDFAIPTVPPDISITEAANGYYFTNICDGAGQIIGNFKFDYVLTSLELPVPPTLEELIGSLSSAVMAINLQAGISNSLDAKLSSALSALDDANTNNDVAALNSMYAFCSSVQAQRGKKLTDTQSDELIAAANSVISALDEFASACDL
jgi:hypothetical protein